MIRDWKEYKGQIAGAVKEIAAANPELVKAYAGFHHASSVSKHLDAKTREVEELQNRNLRLMAEFDNAKKRAAREREDYARFANESLLRELLPVLDTADLAAAHGAAEEVLKLSAALFSALQSEGLDRIDPAGEPFDPTVHDAVLHEPGDGDVQEVSEVMRAGYR